MVTITDIINKIQKNETATKKEFAKKLNMSEKNFFQFKARNKWSKETLKKVGDLIGKDLSKLANCESNKNEQ